MQVIIRLQKKKKQYDKEKLVNSVGSFLMGSAGILILGGILAFLFENQLKSIIFTSWILFTLSIIVGLIYLNVSGCVMKKRITKNKN